MIRQEHNGMRVLEFSTGRAAIVMAGGASLTGLPVVSDGELMEAHDTLEMPVPMKGDPSQDSTSRIPRVSI